MFYELWKELRETAATERLYFKYIAGKHTVKNDGPATFPDLLWSWGTSASHRISQPAGMLLNLLSFAQIMFFFPVKYAAI